MSILIFENPGEIDPRLISAFGVNVKVNDSAIGFFGTGLKYALAGLMRLGQAVTIQSGETTYTIDKVKESIRGKDFEFVRMSWYDNLAGQKTQTLGFTTELGKAWDPWMFYRELQCNATDEQGRVCYRAAQVPQPTAGTTRIIVEGHALTSVHIERSLYFIESEPEVPLAGLNLHPGQTSYLFNKGVAVLHLQHKALFHYNLTDRIALTEDRTVRDQWSVKYAISNALVCCEDPDILQPILLADEACFEHSFDFDCYTSPSETFLNLVAKLATSHTLRLNKSAYAKLCKHRKEAFAPKMFQLSRVQDGALRRAKAFVERLGYDLSPYPIHCVSLGDGVMGLAKDGIIYITSLAFDKGTKQVAATLLEEFLHLSHDVDDYSHKMQDLLFDKIISLGEELQGEPL